MNKIVVAFVLVLLCFPIVIGNVLNAQTIEKIDLWPDLAPGESIREGRVEDVPFPNNNGDRPTIPQLLIFIPERQTSDVCLMFLPGGGFTSCMYELGTPLAQRWNQEGYLVAMVLYRVPRPKSGSIYTYALQDAQRAIRYMRANADKYGIDPNKIGAQGFSAGGTLALLVAMNSTTSSYAPVDQIDAQTADLAFAIPVYPAYVLDDGATDPNVNRGENASILPDFHFDEKTPPMMLLHGDSDIYSSLGSIEVYRRLHSLGIPCEIHVFAGANHGFKTWEGLPNTEGWLESCFAWLKQIGF